MNLPPGQWMLTDFSPTFQASGNGNTSVAEENGMVILNAKGHSISFSKNDGALCSWQHEGRELVKAPLKPNFWRPLTDNDIPNGHLERCAVWKNAADNMKVEQITTVRNDNGLAGLGVAMYNAALDLRLEIAYRLGDNETLDVDYHFIPGKVQAPRTAATRNVDDSPRRVHKYEMVWQGTGGKLSRPQIGIPYRHLRIDCTRTIPPLRKGTGDGQPLRRALDGSHRQ